MRTHAGADMRRANSGLTMSLAADGDTDPNKYPPPPQDPPAPAGKERPDPPPSIPPPQEPAPSGDGQG